MMDLFARTVSLEAPPPMPPYPSVTLLCTYFTRMTGYRIEAKEEYIDTYTRRNQALLPTDIQRNRPSLPMARPQQAADCDN